MSLMLYRLLLLLVLVILLSLGSEWLVAQLQPVIADWQSSWGSWSLLLALPLYIVLLSIPFVPGLEIGLALLIVFGADVAVLVYICTVLALSLSFFAGSLIRLSLLIRLMQFLHLQQAAGFMRQLQGLERGQLVDMLMSRAPHRIVPFLIRHRYIALIVLINLPGNAVVGGGGGVALSAGLSRLFSYRWFLLSISLAVAPVPVLFYFGIVG